jgi:NADH-quinone oxidoreductase subunit N
MLAGWRKRDLRSNEASLKYYLLGVLATGVMLYGMSLIFGATGTTLLTGINQKLHVASNMEPLVTIGIFFVVIGFYPNFIFHVTDGGVQQALSGVQSLAFGK